MAMNGGSRTLHNHQPSTIGMKRTMRTSETGIVDELNRRGVSVWLTGDKVRAFPKPLLTDEVKAIISENRASLVAELAEIESELPKPHINACGDLVIPFNSPRQYHWWAGGQSVNETISQISREIVEDTTVQTKLTTRLDI